MLVIWEDCVHVCVKSVTVHIMTSWMNFNKSILDCDILNKILQN